MFSVYVLCLSLELAAPDGSRADSSALPTSSPPETTVAPCSPPFNPPVSTEIVGFWRLAPPIAALLADSCPSLRCTP